MVEDVGGDGGEIDGDGALADAALLIEDDMNSHEWPSVCFPRVARSTSDEDGASLRCRSAFGTVTRPGSPVENRSSRLTAVNRWLVGVVVIGSPRHPMTVSHSDSLTPWRRLCVTTSHWDGRSHDHRIMR